MERNSGWIRLHRKLLQSPVWQNHNVARVWLWCLLKASHKAVDLLVGHRRVHLEPGQFLYGRRAASKEIRLPPSTIERAMKTLKTGQELARKPDTKFSVVTICNWGRYQNDDGDGGPIADSSADQSRTNRGPIADTNKNDKNVKNDKKTEGKARRKAPPTAKRPECPYFVAFKAAYDDYQPEPYESTTADFVQLARWKKTHSGITPEHFVEVMQWHWADKFGSAAALTLRAACPDWSKLAARVAKSEQQAPPETHGQGLAAESRKF